MTVYAAAAVRFLASTEVRGGERLVAYQFVTKCAHCAKQLGVVWVMDLTRTGPESIARITCPLCRKSFHQHAGDLLPIGSQIQNLVVGRPVRSVEVDYDCSYCRQAWNRGVPSAYRFVVG